MFDLCDRIFSHMHFELHKTDDKSAASLQKCAARDGRRHELKMSVLTCLLSFLSGSVEDKEFANQMLATLNLWEIAKHMDECVRMTKWIDDQDKTFRRQHVLLRQKCWDEGIQYCILLRQLDFFDEDHSVVAPIVLNRQTPESRSIHMAWRDLYSCCGYVEILRNDNLEAIHFQLPKQSGNGYENYDEMYETEREDIDKKNFDWLSNMKTMVRRTELHEKIRQGVWAFAVNYGRTIMNCCLVWAFFIHVFCISGNYSATEDYNALVLSATEDGARRKSAASLADDNTLAESELGFEVTDQDLYFFQHVETPMRWVIRVMTWINLVICVFRIAAFVKADLPMVIHQGITEDADEEEETRVADAEEENVKDGEEEIGFFVLQYERIAFKQDTELEEVKEPSHANMEEVKNDKESQTWFKKVTVALSSVRTLYEMLYILFAVLAVGFDQPLLTTFSLFDICFWPGIRTVLNAFRFNASKMGETILLGLLCMYVWMIIGMLLFNSAVASGLCENMFQW